MNPPQPIRTQNPHRVGVLAIVMLLLSGCVEKMLLPAEINIPVEFSAGDTTYQLINPIWDESYGFKAPIEISIAPDGHVYVADSTAQRIFVLQQDGALPESFSALTQLKDKDGNDMVPIDVDVDRKMNVFFIDGSRHIYRWNQIWNDLGIDSSAASGFFINTLTGDTTTVDAGLDDWFELANDSQWELDHVNWTGDNSLTDSLLKPHLLFDAGSPENEALDIYYMGSLSLFSGLSAANGDFIYATDRYHDRIVRIDLKRSDLIKLATGVEVWTHRGVFGHTVVGLGTGAGTVNDPVAIDVDFAGNIYYAQFGDYFSIHKITPTSTEGYVNYHSVFQQGEDNIMDLWRFSNPADVAVDIRQFIYVANTEAQEIQVFNSDGELFTKAGITEVRVDTTVWIFDGTDTVAVDTFFVVEEKGILQSPRAVAVDDRGIVYVCDTPNSRIVRYRLSNVLDENLIPGE